MKTPQRFKSLDSCETGSDSPIHLAIGMFDGVHTGHRVVIESAIRAAARSRGLSGTLTFWPHPSHLFRPDNAVPMILEREAKFAELEKMRIDFVVQEPFTPEFAAIEAIDFVDMLKSKLPRLASIHTGDNWKFGKGRIGDTQLLSKLAERAGIKYESLDCLYVGGERVSSTRIRHSLLEGRTEEANRLLGYDYESFGEVTEGKRMGRTIGVPTLNTPFTGELRPKYGVYAVTVSRERGNEQLPAVANFGVRPTINSLEEPLLESHVLGECPFTYGDRLRVEWKRFLRPETKFAGVDALKMQIQKDISEAEAYFQSSDHG